MKEPSYFWGDFWTKFTFVIVGLYYGAIPGFAVLLLTGFIPLAIIVMLVCGFGAAVFIDRSCDRERERKAERAKGAHRKRTSR